MRIVGPASVDLRKVELKLGEWRRTGRIAPLFIDGMYKPLWYWSTEYHIDPVGVISQSIKETDGGKYSGRVMPEFYNTCGLKIRHLGLIAGTGGDMPLAHQMFPNWSVGALAHVQHVCAYAGWSMNEMDVPIVDPRYQFIVDSKLENWSEFGSGKWAPGVTYGIEVEAIMQEFET